MVLRARVNVQLRNEKISEDVYKNGDFCFDFGKMEFTKGNTVLELSKTEQKLLRCFIENKGKNLSRSQLIDYIWQGDTEYVEEHALTVVVNRLRTNLEMIRNVLRLYMELDTLGREFNLLGRAEKL